MFYILVALCFLGFYIIHKRIYNVWNKKNVPHPKPVFFFGNFLDSVLRRKAIWKLVDDAYNAFPNERYFGFYQFTSPILVLKDPELIKQITVKDFDSFPEHRDFVPEETDQIWSNNLFAMKVEKWKEMRPTLSPAFTGSKMKFMFQLIQDCGEQFCNYFTDKQDDVIEVELKDVFTKYTNDVVAATAFGLRCDSLKDKDNKFYKMGRKLTNFQGIKMFKFFLYNISPWIQKVLDIKMVEDDLRSFFEKVIKDTLRMRREEGLVKQDMIHLLLEAQKGLLDNQEGNKLKKKYPITDDVIVAQALIFFVAGFDTSSSLMTLTGYELMMNPDIQARLREEIDSTYEECDGKITYEAIVKMKYLDMVISETLRKWPPLPFIDRKCVKNYTIPAQKPTEQPLEIEKDYLVWIPVFPLHRDPEYFPDPDKFDPERFNDENKHKIKNYTYVPFGSGPKNCIGSRFAILENKVIWFNLLRHFELVPTENSPIPVEWDHSHFIYYPVNGFKMGLKKRILSKS